MQQKKNIQNEQGKKTGNIAVQSDHRVPEIFIGILFFLFAVLSLTALLGKIDPDIFWRIKQGELVVKEAKFSTQDYFSYTRFGKPLHAHAWLSEVIFYLIYSVSGYFGIALFETFLLTATLFLLFMTIRKIGISQKGGLILTSLCFLNFLVFMAPRAQNFTFLLFALSLYLAVQWEKGDESAPWKIAVLSPFWVNLHSGFMLGLLVLFLIAIAKIRESKEFNLKFFAPFFVSVALTALHPNGIHQTIFPVQMIFSNPIEKATVTEMKPLDFSEPAIFYPYFMILAGAVLLGVRQISSRFLWDILFLGFLYQSLAVMRMVPLFAIASAVAIAVRIKEMEETKFIKISYLTVSLFSVIMIFRYFYPGYQKVYPWKESDWDKIYPRESVKIVKEKYPEKNIFSSYDWGGYLLFHLYPDNKVAIDSRGADLYGQFLGRGYQEITQVGPKAKKLLDYIKTDIVIFPAKTRLSAFLNSQPEWECVLHTPKETVFIRKPGTIPDSKFPPQGLKNLRSKSSPSATGQELPENFLIDPEIKVIPDNEIRE